jgi:hypothetical protein
MAIPAFPLGASGLADRFVNLITHDLEELRKNFSGAGGFSDAMMRSVSDQTK